MSLPGKTKAELFSILLEGNPEKFLEVIRDDSWLRDGGVNDITVYEAFFSPLILQLLRRVGNLVNPSKNLRVGSFGVSEVLGILILKELVLAGADPEVQNYYRDSFKEIVLDYEKKCGRWSTYRKNNENFLKEGQLFVNDPEGYRRFISSQWTPTKSCYQRSSSYSKELVMTVLHTHTKLRIESKENDSVLPLEIWYLILMQLPLNII